MTTHPDYVLETERLILKRLSLDDAPFILTLVNSPGWLQYIGDRNVHSLSQTHDYLINGPLKSYQQHGFGLSLIVRKEDLAPIGMCGLLKRDYLDYPDIGYALLSDFAGQGYALEIASAVVAHARQQLNIPVISAIVDPDNQRSIRLLERLGLVYKKTIHSPDTNKELFFFEN